MGGRHAERRPHRVVDLFRSLQRRRRGRWGDEWHEDRRKCGQTTDGKCRRWSAGGTRRPWPRVRLGSRGPPLLSNDQRERQQRSHSRARKPTHAHTQPTPATSWKTTSLTTTSTTTTHTF